MIGAARPTPPSFRELFAPKLFTVLREGYGLADFRADLTAGLTVAIVALPLSMAIGIASGVTPDRGLYAAIIGGFLVSALGGSRFQIGGPAGAFIVLVAATVAQHGVAGLMLATLLSGLILLAIGFLQLGSFIKYIPYPVTIGFTAGIAVIIFASQLKELLGLTLAAPEPGPIVPKMEALAAALPSANLAAIAVAAGTVGVILAVRRWRPLWPSFLIAVTLASLAAWAFGLQVETIGTRFGGIPSTLPAPRLPDLSPGRVLEMLPAALSFALLGGIESLLSAVVADSMTGRRHRSNCELVAQGVANIASALFGGICVTGTIARTATNVRAGARGPVVGHVALRLPAAVHARGGAARELSSRSRRWPACWRSSPGTWRRSTRSRPCSGPRAAMPWCCGVTFLLVVFRDLTEGILVGSGSARCCSCIGWRRRSRSRAASDDRGGSGQRCRSAMPSARPTIAALATDRDVVVYRISGAFFFGAAAAVGAALDRIGEHPKAYVIDVSAVPLLNSTAAATIEGFARKARRQGARCTSPVHGLRSVASSGAWLRPPLVRFAAQLADAVEAARAEIRSDAPNAAEIS